MVAVQVRDVPDAVRDALVEQARSRGQSLQSFLLDLLTAQAWRSANLATAVAFDGRSDGSRVTLAETVAEIRRMRAERVAQLAGSPEEPSGRTG